MATPRWKPERQRRGGGGCCFGSRVQASTRVPMSHNGKLHGARGPGSRDSYGWWRPSFTSLAAPSSPTKPRSKYSRLDNDAQISLTLPRSAPGERRPPEKFCLQPGSRTSSLPLAIFQAKPDYTVTVVALERVNEFCLVPPKNRFHDVCPLTARPSVLLIKVPACDTWAYPELHRNHHCSFLLLALHSPLSLLKKDSGTLASAMC